MPRELTVERVVPGGSGLGRLDGAVTLVSGGLPGDRLLVDPQSDGPRLVRADVVSVIEPGPHRRPEEEVCPRARDGSCGGCDWPALRLESHGTLKEEIQEGERANAQARKEGGEVARERGRVARDEEETPRPDSQERLPDDGREPLARRVGKDDVERLAHARYV